MSREQISIERQGQLQSENARLLLLIRELLDRASERGEELRRLSELSALQSLALRSLNHECRSPLQSIFGMTTLLLRKGAGPLTEEQAQLVGLLRKAADDIVELIEDFTDPERVARTPVRRAFLNPAELLRTLQGMLPAPLIKPGVALVFAADKNIPPLVSDERKILQILRNLVNNALRFTARGEVRVGAMHDPTSGTVAFSVTDTGPGIAREQQKELAQGNLPREAIRGRAPRKGLGLPLCHRLAAALGGKISLESAPGRGSTFSLLLPYSQSVDAPLDLFSARLAGDAAAGDLAQVFHAER